MDECHRPVQHKRQAWTLTRSSGYISRYALAQIGIPYCIVGVVEYLLYDDKWSTAEAVGFALGLGAVCWLAGQMFLLTYYSMQRVGMEVRAAMMNAIYRQCLRVSTAESGRIGLGRSSNLMSVDAEKLYLTAQYLHALWMFPVLCVTVLGTSCNAVT